MKESLSYGSPNHLNQVELEFVKITAESPTKETPKESGLYLVFGKQGEVLYVGESKNLRSRLSAHFNGHVKGGVYKDRISHVMYAVFMADRYERAVVEGILVSKYVPIFNSSDNDLMDSRGHEVNVPQNPPQKHLTKEDFFKIRDYVLKYNHTQKETADIFGVSTYTILNITHLHSNKYKRWESERLLQKQAV